MLLEQFRVEGKMSWVSYERLASIDANEARWVLKRLRPAPHPQMIELAARLGHEPSLHCFPNGWTLESKTDNWLEKLDEWDKKAFAAGATQRVDAAKIRAAVAVLHPLRMKGNAY